MNKLPQGEKFVIADPLYHLLPEDRKKTAFLNIFAADMAKQAVEMDARQRAAKNNPYTVKSDNYGHGDEVLDAAHDLENMSYGGSVHWDDET